MTATPTLYDWCGGHDALLRRNVDHPMVGSNDQRDLGWQSSTQPLAHGIDPRQLLEPGSRTTAVYVPTMIKFSLVGVNHAVITT